MLQAREIEADRAKRRQRVERITAEADDDQQAICQLDSEADDAGEQESGYGPGRYWIFFHSCRVRYEEGNGFRVDDDPDYQPADVLRPRDVYGNHM